MRLTRKGIRIAIFVAIAHNLLLVALAFVVWSPAFRNVSSDIRSTCFYIFGWDVLIQLTVSVIWLIAMLLKMVFDIARNFHGWDAQEKYWQYFVVVLLLCQSFQIIPFILYLKGLYDGARDFHFADAVFVRIEIVSALLALGIGVYLVKVWSKALFGLAEVTVALVSNSALIKTLDLSGFPKIRLNTSQVLAIGAFTYLLSKGISNAIEGFEDMRKKKAETPAVADLQQAQTDS